MSRATGLRVRRGGGTERNISGLPICGRGRARKHGACEPGAITPFLGADRWLHKNARHRQRQDDKGTPPAQAGAHMVRIWCAWLFARTGPTRTRLRRAVQHLLRTSLLLCLLLDRFIAALLVALLFVLCLWQGTPRATDYGNTLTTERLFWHCGAHTAEQKIGPIGPIPPIRVYQNLPFSVARGWVTRTAAECCPGTHRTKCTHLLSLFCSLSWKTLVIGHRNC